MALQYTINPETGKFEAINVSGGVAGNDTELQYNDGGVQAGAPVVTYDKVNDSLNTKAKTLGTTIVTTFYTAVESDNTIICNAQLNIQLPNLANTTVGRELLIKSNNTGTVAVIGGQGELIDDRNIILLRQYESIRIVNAITNWVIIGAAVAFPDGTRSKCFMDEVDNVPVNFTFQQDGDDYEYQDSAVPVPTIKEYQELTDVDFQDSETYTYQGV